MAFNYPDSDNSVVQGVPSSYGDQLITRAEYYEQKANNHIFHQQMMTKHDMVIKILKGHPIFYALTDAEYVPLLYVQQFWKNLQYKPDAGNHHSISKVDHFIVSFGVNKIRELLHFP